MRASELFFNSLALIAGGACLLTDCGKKGSYKNREA